MFAKSVVARYPQGENDPKPILAAYMDDIFGGLMYCESLSKGLHLRRYICDTGTSLTLVFNMKPAKTPLPAKKQIILGRLYNSISRRVCTGEKKRLKYRKKIEEILQAEDTTVKALQKIHCYLN